MYICSASIVELFLYSFEYVSISMFSNCCPCTSRRSYPRPVDPALVEWIQTLRSAMGSHGFFVVGHG